jgi:glycosyltransferase involved in cell wall biosynthesis
MLSSWKTAWCGANLNILEINYCTATIVDLIEATLNIFVMSETCRYSSKCAMATEAANSRTSATEDGNEVRVATGERPGRILFVAYTDYKFDARVKRHAEALAQHGYAVDVISLADESQFDRTVKINGIRAGRYRGHSRAEYLRRYLGFFTKAVYKAARLNHDYHYEAVIVCSIPDAAIVSGLIPKLTGSKLVLDMHDTMPELYQEKFPGAFGTFGAAALRLEERMSARMADLVFAVHDLHAARLRETGIAPEKIVVILNTPDPRLFSPPQSDVQHACNSFTVVTHGTINRRLGLDTAIDALKLVQNQLPNIRFRILGPGEHRESVRAHVKQLGLENIVEFEDGVPLEILADALRDASLGIVPNEATPATELMLPVKLLEYVNLGIPVIASNLRTIRHYFPEDAIRYFTPSNPESMAEALMHMYLHPEERRRQAFRAGEVAKVISWEVQRQKLTRTIELLIAGATARSISTQRSMVV